MSCSILSSLIYRSTFNVHVLFQFYFTIQLVDDINFLKSWLYICHFFIEIPFTWADSVSATMYHFQGSCLPCSWCMAFGSIVFVTGLTGYFRALAMHFHLVLDLHFGENVFCQSLLILKLKVKFYIQKILVLTLSGLQESQ